MRLDSDHPLLGGLPRDEAAWVRDTTREVVLAEGETLVEPGARMERAVFLVDAAVSLRAGAPRGRSIELAVLGRGQLPGAGALLADAPCALALHVVQPGRALALPAPGAGLWRGKPVLLGRLRGCAAGEAALVAAAAARLAFGTARQRLAAHLADMWIATEERLLAVHHEALAGLLGLRRATVTVALQELEDLHAVKARRGFVEIVDPQALEDASF